MSMPPWSYSSLTAFETCPRQYHIMRVLKLVKEAPSEHIQWGKEVHTAFELGIKNNKPLPEKMSEWQPILMKFQKVEGTKEAELQLAVDKSFRPVGWWDKTAWARGIGDLVVERNTSALSVDWKTGKRKIGSEQLRMFAALLMNVRGHLQRVRTSFVWLPVKKLDTDDFARDDLKGIWADFIPRTVQMEKSFDTDKWPARPSGLCNGWCSVGKDNCEFWQPKRST